MENSKDEGVESETEACGNICPRLNVCKETLDFSSGFLPTVAFKWLLNEYAAAKRNLHSK